MRCQCFYSAVMANSKLDYLTIDQFRYIKIQAKTIDFSTRLLGITRVCGVYSHEPRTEVHCFSLNFNISKLVY